MLHNASPQTSLKSHSFSKSPCIQRLRPCQAEDRSNLQSTAQFLSAYTAFSHPRHPLSTPIRVQKGSLNGIHYGKTGSWRALNPQCSSASRSPDGIFSVNIWFLRDITLIMPPQSSVMATPFDSRSTIHFLSHRTMSVLLSPADSPPHPIL
jgi:hypothetical protein